MKRIRQLLIGLILVELVAGAVASGWRLAQQSPPAPQQSAVDALTAADLDRLVRRAATAAQWCELAEGYMATGYFREAEACHRVAAELRPADAELTRQWAFSLERCGELAAANEAYERAAKQDPKLLPSCQYAIGRNHLRQNDIPAAKAAFKRCGDLPGARYELARLQLRSGQPAEAARLAEDLARRFPETQEPPRLLYQAALAAEETGPAETYADLQDRLPDLLPSPQGADRLRLVAARERLGVVGRRVQAQRAFDARDFATARRLLEEGIAARKEVMSEDLLAEVAFHQNRLEESAALLEDILRRHGPTPHHWERLGDTYHAQKHKDKARKAWQQASQLAFGPPVRGAYRKLAVYAQGVGQGGEASRQFALASLAEGITSFRAGDTRAAATALMQAADQNRELPQVWYYIGETARVEGDTASARLAYERCLSLAPNHGRAADRLAALQ